MPDVLPVSLDKVDPAYLAQMQLQLHATGADIGYLVSWARKQLSVIKVPYSFDFVQAAARVLVHVVTDFVTPETLPRIPHDATGLSSEHQNAVKALVTALSAVKQGCTTFQLPQGVLPIPMCCFLTA